jgi:hypothetical protein
MGNRDAELFQQLRDCPARGFLCSEPDDAFLEREQGVEARSYRRFKGLNFSLEELDELFAVGTHGIRKRHPALQRWYAIRATAMTRLHRR